MERKQAQEKDLRFQLKDKITSLPTKEIKIKVVVEWECKVTDAYSSLSLLKYISPT